MFVLKNLLNIDYNEMAMYPDEYVYDHEDHLVLQMSYHNKNIYEAFSKIRINFRSEQTYRIQVYFCMCHTMIIQIWTCCKTFPTYFTWMWLNEQSETYRLFKKLWKLLFLHYVFDNECLVMMMLKMLFHMLDKRVAFHLIFFSW